MASIQRREGESYATYQERRKLVAGQRKLVTHPTVARWAHRIVMNPVTKLPMSIGITYRKDTHGPL